MAAFNASASSSAAAAAADVLSATTTATFLVPTTGATQAGAISVAGTPHHHLQLDQFGGYSAGHHHQQQTNSSYTFVQIKREPCQVSEISSNNCHQQQSPHQAAHPSQPHLQGSVTASATSKTMSSSTLTTLVKIEAPSPKVTDLEKSSSRFPPRTFRSGDASNQNHFSSSPRQLRAHWHRRG